ncbi:MAG: HD domain-containing protein [Candidatus Nanohaloarchaea archaeon]|nr:HD domain-containing protein [Candidatus Nanohaloarchaea archaeon]
MMDIDSEGNEKLDTILTYVEENDHIRQYWRSANIMAKERLELNDHGEKHIEIVCKNSIRLLRLLKDEQEPGIVADYEMEWEDAEVVVVLAALLHDVGHIIHRYKHSEYSLPIAKDLVEEVLEDVYSKKERVIMQSEILHAIQSHHKKANPLTLEAGILRVADSLDMEKGRARKPQGNEDDVSIHTISALAIEKVEIKEGEEKPVRIEIEMSNSAGLFQLDELARRKIEGSGLEDVIHLTAEIEGEEKNILSQYEL